MGSMMFAQGLAGFSLLQLFLLIVVVAAALAILYAVVNRMGITVDPLIVKVGSILLVAVIGIFALVFLFSLIGRI